MNTLQRFLYLHGFASGPGSFKGVKVAEHYAARGIEIQRLNLRLPSFEHLRVSAMIAHVEQALGGPRDRAVLFGSSLGGYVASRVAERDPRVCSLVLLAPAFRLFSRWRARMGEDAWQAWRHTGWLEVHDHAEKKKARVDFGFVEEAQAMDASDAGFPDVRVPTLIIHGTRDDTVDIAASRDFAAGKPHVRLVETDDGHELAASLPVILRESERHLAACLDG